MQIRVNRLWQRALFGVALVAEILPITLFAHANPTPPGEARSAIVSVASTFTSGRIADQHQNGIVTRLTHSIAASLLSPSAPVWGHKTSFGWRHALPGIALSP